MLRVLSVTGAVRPTRLLLAYNKSSGYRWSPIPKPPPPHYDRLYGVHSVLNTLRVAAAAAQQQQQQQRQQPIAASPTSPSPGEAEFGMEGKRCAASSSFATDAHPTDLVGPHPHRAHLSCLYVRDFSAEEEEAAEGGRGKQQKPTPFSQTRLKTNGAPPSKKKKTIPLRYTAVRCIAALAKSLDVPVRFVPRNELVQLCGERRNQNVVLEASSYVAHGVRQLDDIWRFNDDSTARGAGGGTYETSPAAHQAASSSSPCGELVLFLEHIIDPTNIGGILRTAFFFGVDHVILSRDCAACTATVSRTSTGFLEHLNVHRATVSTADFLRASRLGSSSSSSGRGGGGRLEVVASAVVSREPVASSPSELRTSSSLTEDLSTASADPEKTLTAVVERTTSDRARGDGTTKTDSRAEGGSYRPDVRVLLLGNEDAGLPPALLQWCTHVAHVRSPRQLRLRQARQRVSSSSNSNNSNNSRDRPVRSSDTEVPLVLDEAEDHRSDHDRTSKPPLSEVERREHNLQRLARLREKEVSLNVNTATAALLTALVAVDGELPPSALLGLVEVQAYLQ